MTVQAFDATTFKVGQRREWDGSAAGWTRWFDTLQAGMAPMTDVLLDRARLREGHRVLDLATGYGEPALTAAARVGATGSVVAVDLSREMLAVARRRHAELVPEVPVDFVEADVEELELAPSTFDAALCRLGLMLMPDAAGVVRRVRETLVPDGRFAASVPGAPPDMPVLGIPVRVIAEELGLRPPVGAPGLFSLSDPSVLAEAFRLAGFVEVDTEHITGSIAFESPQEYVEFMRDIAGAVNAMLAGQAEDVRERVWRRIEESAASFARDDGSVAMPLTAICVSGRRPETG